MPLLITPSRIKIRDAIDRLRVGHSLPYLIKTNDDRMSAYYFARKHKPRINISIRKSLVRDGFELTRIK